MFNYRNHKLGLIAASSKVQMDLPDIGAERVNRAFAVMDVTPKSSDYGMKHIQTTRNSISDDETIVLMGELIDSNAEKAIRIKRLETVGDEVIQHLLDLLNQKNEAAESVIRERNHDIASLAVRVKCLEMELNAAKRTIRTLKSWTSKYRSQLLDERAIGYDLFLQLQESERNAQTQNGVIESAIAANYHETVDVREMNKVLDEQKRQMKLL